MMTNREKHLDEILAVQHWGNFNGEIRGCGNCPECDFNDGSNIFIVKRQGLHGYEPKLMKSRKSTGARCLWIRRYM